MVIAEIAGGNRHLRYTHEAIHTAAVLMTSLQTAAIICRLLNSKKTSRSDKSSSRTWYSTATDVTSKRSNNRYRSTSSGVSHHTSNNLRRWQHGRTYSADCTTGTKVSFCAGTILSPALYLESNTYDYHFI